MLRCLCYRKTWNIICYSLLLFFIAAAFAIQKQEATNTVSSLFINNNRNKNWIDQFTIGDILTLLLLSHFFIYTTTTLPFLRNNYYDTKYI